MKHYYEDLIEAEYERRLRKNYDPGFPWTDDNIKALFVGYMREHATDLLMLVLAAALIWLAW